MNWIIEYVMIKLETYCTHVVYVFQYIFNILYSFKVNFMCQWIILSWTFCVYYIVSVDPSSRYISNNFCQYSYYASKGAHFVKLPSYPFLELWTENVEKNKEVMRVGKRGKKRKMKNEKSRKPRFLFSPFSFLCTVDFIHATRVENS